ncbi:MAG: LysM peptidoglycan-binding domain-containing protein [Chlamydiae bacterium]|nr:LysM peptidoglycan-binding domain-containing protein [Chlamydiota bacterium]
MDATFTQRWIRKFRILTFALIFSGALNIGLIAAFGAVLWQQRQPTFAFAQQTSIKNGPLGSSNVEWIKRLSQLSFRELSACLTNKEPLEEGYAKRDLALAVLGTYRHVDIERALAGSLHQKRILSLGTDQTIQLYPGLSDEQFKAIIQFVYLEKWPLTPKGLFKLVQKGGAARDPSLEAAFLMTPEFHALQLLFQKTDASQDPASLIQLASEGSWDLLDRFASEQTQMLDLSQDKRRRLLLSYLALKSPSAADLLLRTDFDFLLKKLDDQGILDLLDLVRAEELESFCMELLKSPRSDAVWEKSARILYARLGEPLPAPFDLQEAIARFVPSSAQKRAQTFPVPEMKPVASPWIFHTVSEGESLWKISRHYQVKVDEILRANEMEKDRLYPGMTLRIPAH